MMNTTEQILNITAQYHESKARADLDRAIAQHEALRSGQANPVVVTYAAECVGKAKQEYEDNLRSENRARVRSLWL